jgi:type IV secretion system protein VirB11
MADLVRSTLRLRPDRIIVGEIRGAEALDMLKAWNTGHPGGIATVHANSAASALLRIEQLVQESVTTVPRALIAEAIDLIIFIAGRGHARRVETVLRVNGLRPDGAYDLAVLRETFHPSLQTQPKEIYHDQIACLQPARCLPARRGACLLAVAC